MCFPMHIMHNGYPNVNLYSNRYLDYLYISILKKKENLFFTWFEILNIFHVFSNIKIRVP